MADRSAPDYKALFEEAQQGQRHAEEQQRKAEEQQRKAEEQQRKAEEQQRKAEEQQRRAEERTQKTTFAEYVSACHRLLSVPLRVAQASRSTKGGIPVPTGKYCPTKLREWTDFPARQADVYNIVRRYLQPANASAPRLFSSLIALEDLGQSLCQRPISSEKDLEGVERYGKDRHVHDIVAALCEIPSARQELRLGRGLRFESHANALDQEVTDTPVLDPVSGRMQPDQFCVHRLDDNSSTLLMTVEYKPPHKLSVENLCAGLRPMNFWDEVVNTETIPTDGAEKLRYNAARLTGAAIVQEYHVMIQEGLAFSCLSTGIALVFLHVPEEDPSTLYYYLCVPNMDVPSDGEDCAWGLMTAVARLLCLSLMSCTTSLRSNAWRNRVKNSLHTWQIDFEYTRSQIPDEQLNETPPGSEYVPSSPIQSPEEGRRRRSTRLYPGCTPSPDVDGDDSSDTSDSDPNQGVPSRKRNYSDVASSPLQPHVRRPRPCQNEVSQTQHTASRFCTQKCLLGLKQCGLLDKDCPNVSDHRRGQQTDSHLVSASEMVCLLKEQLDGNVDDQCIPFGSCGVSGAPFKLRCISHGYVIIGKGTTSRLWSTVSREANFYRVLHSVQSSAVPVFLGTITMKQTYFLHGAGEIQHMLLMAWGGEPLTQLQWHARLKAVNKSHAEIRKLGVQHGDVRPENSLWNEELDRVLLIDFHKSKLIDRKISLLKRNGKPSLDEGIKACKRRRLVT